MTVPFPYHPEIEKAMQVTYLSLREHDRRLYSAVEVAKLGHGGLEYICSVLGCDPKTVRQGEQDLQALKDKDPNDLGPRPRVRKPGGGRKPHVEQMPDLKRDLHRILENHTAGSPMKQEVFWTDLTPKEIQEAFRERDCSFGLPFIRQLLREEGYRPLKARKDLEMGSHPDRNAQFENIARIKQEYLGSDNPIVSIDTKKRELIGTFYRAGRVYTRHGLLAYDHDFPSFAEGVVVPYSIYDLKRNFGYVNLGTSRDTTEFACDSILWWWTNYGQGLYSAAKSICLLCDGGGSNSAAKYLFKEDLQKLADTIGLEVRVAHYPPYCSKFNPIERRLFPHMTRAAQGVLFDSVETVKRLFEKTHTAKGLGVVVTIAQKLYETGRKYAEGFKETMKILFDDVLPRWNYRAVPSAA
jgi:Rhodopirellula transposase DDE domain